MLDLDATDVRYASTLLSGVVGEVNKRLHRSGEHRHLVNVEGTGYKIASPSEMRSEFLARQRAVDRQQVNNLRLVEKVVRHLRRPRQAERKRATTPSTRKRHCSPWSAASNANPQRLARRGTAGRATRRGRRLIVQGVAWRGGARLRGAGLGVAWRGLARRGAARLGEAGSPSSERYRRRALSPPVGECSGQGGAGPGMAGHGWAWRGTARRAAGPGLAGRGRARRGLAGLGKAGERGTGECRSLARRRPASVAGA